MRLKNRLQADQLLAQKLKKYKQKDCIVYAQPKSGIPIGAEIASSLNTPLDIIIPRRVGHLDWVKYAVYAVTEKGTVICNNKEVGYLDPHFSKEAFDAEHAEARRRRRVYITGHRRISPTIIAENGIATGLVIQNIPMTPARLDGWEDTRLSIGSNGKLLISKEMKYEKDLWRIRINRAIGVIYDPEPVRGNYTPTLLPSRYDDFLYISTSQWRFVRSISSFKKILVILKHSRGGYDKRMKYLNHNHPLIHSGRKGEIA